MSDEIYNQLLTECKRKNCNIPFITELLNKGAIQGSNGNDEPLYWAVAMNHVQVVGLLLTHKTSAKIKDFALSEASRLGYVSMVELLLEYGADVHADDDEALRWAYMNGHIATVQLLLTWGANVHAEENEPLRLVSKMGQYEIARLLLKWGANVEAKNDEALFSVCNIRDRLGIDLLAKHYKHVPKNRKIPTSIKIQIFINNSYKRTRNISSQFLYRNLFYTHL